MDKKISQLLSAESLADTDLLPVVQDVTTTPITKSASWQLIRGQIPNQSFIINGNFDIWQRGTSFTAIATATYSADRWKYFKSGSMVHTISQDTDVPTFAQSGTKSNYSLKVDCTTADSSIAGNEYCFIKYALEGYDYANLKEKQITLSFWVKGTKTGTHCVAFHNNGSDRSYIAEYTISGSETWEKKTISLFLNQSGGTENYTNGSGLGIDFILASGSTFYTTANTWQTGNYRSTSNQVNACDSTSNNFWLSQIKIEIGSTATPMYTRLISEELKLCQRYYEKSYNASTNPGSNSYEGSECMAIGGASEIIWDGFPYCGVRYKVSKRVAPTNYIYSIAGSANQISDGTGTNLGANTGLSTGVGETGFTLYNNGGSISINIIRYHWVADAEL